MRKRDWTIPIGAALGFGVLILAAGLENLSLGFILSGPAALVVFGGTFSAVVVRHGFEGVKSAFVATYRVIFDEPDDESEHRDVLARLAWLSKAANVHGFKTFESLVDETEDPLVANGFLLLSDEASTERIESSLDKQIDREWCRKLDVIGTIRAAAGYAPTFGVLGAVLGLAGVMKEIDNPTALAAGISSAFVATIYGIALANLLLLPLASRLQLRAEEQIERRREIAEVLTSLRRGKTPRAIINRFNLIK